MRLRRVLCVVVVLASLVTLLHVRSLHEAITITVFSPLVIGTDGTVSLGNQTARRSNFSTPSNGLLAVGHADTKRPRPTRKGGRDGADASHGDIPLHPESHVRHAWGVVENQTIKCHGTLPECWSADSRAYVASSVLLGIVTGSEDAFRVELSQCSWLRAFPEANVLVFTDQLPLPAPRTPHEWIACKLPQGMMERDGDFFSEYIPKGYVDSIRRAGQGYSAAWVLAQTRFYCGLAELATRMQRTPSLQWAMLIDDDTIVNTDALVRRISKIDSKVPFYFSRTGWGGAGHLYTRAAMEQVRVGLSDCVERWALRQFRASDAMLLKCAHHLKLRVQKEATMSHCPASTSIDALRNPMQVTMHGKKDFYPAPAPAPHPMLMAAWRLGLYYLAMYCRTPGAAEAAFEWSACTYGSSCRRDGCNKELDAARAVAWRNFSHADSLLKLPFDQVIVGNSRAVMPHW
jgi:hypothetical protein